MGRKKIEIDADMVEALAADGLAEYQIAEELGVSQDTFAARKSEPESGVMEALRRGRKYARGAVENVAYKAALKALEDPRYQTSLLFWLKARAGWKERQVVEVEEKITVEEARRRALDVLERLAEDGEDGDSGTR